MPAGSGCIAARAASAIDVHPSETTINNSDRNFHVRVQDALELSDSTRVIYYTMPDITQIPVVLGKLNGNPLLISLTRISRRPAIQDDEGTARLPVYDLSR